MKGFIAFVLMALFSITLPVHAQDAKEKPFSFTVAGITITGTYSEGALTKHPKAESIFSGDLSVGVAAKQLNAGREMASAALKQLSTFPDPA